jgi:hypothetical protein
MWCSYCSGAGHGAAHGHGMCKKNRCCGATFARLRVLFYQTPASSDVAWKSTGSGEVFVWALEGSTTLQLLSAGAVETTVVIKTGEIFLITKEFSYSTQVLSPGVVCRILFTLKREQTHSTTTHALKSFLCLFHISLSRRSTSAELRSFLQTALSFKNEDTARLCICILVTTGAHLLE